MRKSRWRWGLMGGVLATATLMAGLSWAQVTGGVLQNGALGASAADNTPNVLIILDASYSMKEKLRDGETKMSAAKRSILQLLQTLPPHVNVGLRIYGDSTNSFTLCRASRLLTPLGQNNRNYIASQLLNVKPTGATPISYALTRAIEEDFATRPGPKSIILVSDGIETCGADPCQVAVGMVRSGVNVKIDVVGLGLRDLDAIKQLKCVALSTLGKYYTADTAAQLGESMTRSVGNIQAEVQGRILIPGGRNP